MQGKRGNNGFKRQCNKRIHERNRRFADVFNSFVYEGDQVIRPESLQEQDTTELFNFYGISDKNGVSIEIIAKSLSLPKEKIRSWILSAGLQIL